MMSDDTDEDDATHVVRSSEIPLPGASGPRTMTRQSPHLSALALPPPPPLPKALSRTVPPPVPGRVHSSLLPPVARSLPAPPVSRSTTPARTRPPASETSVPIPLARTVGATRPARPVERAQATDDDDDALTFVARSHGAPPLASPYDDDDALTHVVRGGAVDEDDDALTQVVRGGASDDDDVKTQVVRPRAALSEPPMRSGPRPAAGTPIRGFPPPPAPPLQHEAPVVVRQEAPPFLQRQLGSLDSIPDFRPGPDLSTKLLLLLIFVLAMALAAVLVMIARR